ncbi:MAG: gliding motility-associated C-terminal domain-containing protein [Bacteroidales bacterium]|jgi:gliding motility-associated-like protein|nr:gliding motility-associated C-terminal domain-containing protein [Bacteroidales bacterium]
MKKHLLLLIIFSFLITKIFSQANPTNVFQHQITYTTEGQSMWGDGEAFSIDMDHDLVNFDEHPSLNFGDTYDTEIAGEYGLEVDLEIGIYLKSTFSMHGFTSGSIDINYPVTITLDYPDHYSFDHGEIIPIHTSYVVNSGWDLTSHFPSAGIVALDLEYGFAIDFQMRICVFDCWELSAPFGFPSSESATTSYCEHGMLHDSLAIFYINTLPVGPDNPYGGQVAYPCLNEFNFPTICNDNFLPISIPDFLGIGLTGSITIPYVDTEDQLTSATCYNGLNANGEMEWAWFNLDVLDFLQFFVQFIPVYGEGISTAIDIIQGEYDLIGALTGNSVSDYVTLEYYLLHVNIYMASVLVQDFDFCPTIEATFTFPTPLEYWETQPYAGNNVVESGTNSVMTVDVRNDLNIKYPCYDWDSMQVLSVHYHLIPTFRNHTTNELRFTLLLDAIYFHFIIDIPIPGFSPIPSFELPNVSDETIIASAIDLQEIDYSQVQVNEINNNPEETNDTLPNAPKWGFDFCLPPNCQPLISISPELGTLIIPIFDKTWEIGGWNTTDTTVAGTWLYPRPELEIDTSHQDIICFGDTTGLLHIEAIWSTGNFTFDYSWPPTSITQSSRISELYVPSGTYTVTVTDTWGCSKSAPFTVNDINPEIITDISADDVLCYETATGNLYSQVSGGVPPYTWNWSPSGSTAQNPIGVFAGTHYLTVTDSQGCTKTYSIFVNEPPQIVITDTITDVSCNGIFDGSISIDVSGGVSPYSYLWSNGATTSSNTNLLAGTYEVTITDANLCETIMSYQVSEPEELEIILDATDVLCYGENSGTIYSYVSGGTAPYSYMWSNDETTDYIIDVESGVYWLTVTDDHNCEAAVFVAIIQPDAPLSSEIIPFHNICFGGNVGSANLTVTGGIEPYTYYWNTTSTSEDLFNLTAGIYTVTITDANGCTLVNSVEIEQPPQIVVVPTITAVSCYGLADGAISLSEPTGGEAPFTYYWSNNFTTSTIQNLPAATYTVTITDNIGCTTVRSFNVTQPMLLNVVGGIVTDVLCYGESTGSVNITVQGGTLPYIFTWSNGASTEDLTNIPSGNFTVIVMDAHGCQTSQSFQVVQPFAPLTITINIQNVNCYGEANGSADLTPAGGTPPYFYEWNTGSILEDLTNVYAGDYAVTVTDSHGCVISDSVKITQPPLLTMSSEIHNVTCFGLSNGSILLSTSGGVAPITYTWSDGSISQTRNNIISGSYTVTISDSHNCQIVRTFAVAQPAELQVNTNIMPIMCYGQNTGIIDLQPTGGTQPYNYMWNTGQSSEDLINVMSGNYFVTIYDANSCQTQLMVIVEQPAFPLNVNIDAHNISCFAAADGAIDLTVTGGTTPYYYTWSTGAISEDIYDLIPNSYYVTVTDSHYCNSINLIQITQPTAPMSGTISGTHIDCNGESTGNVYIAVVGGTIPYHYQWSNGSWEQNLTNVPAGHYVVTITDANACQYIMEYTVNQPSPFYVYSNIPPDLCQGMSTEIIISMLSGNNPPYTVNWLHGANGITTTVSPTETTTYTALITDIKGCTTSAEITVKVLDTLILSVSTIQDIVCPNDTVPFFVHVEGGGTSGNYVYINGTKTEITIPIWIPIPKDTTLVFEITDVCNFSKKLITKNIHVASNPPIDIESNVMEGCSPLVVHFYENSDDVGQTYLWNFSDGDFENLSIDKNPVHTFYNSNTFNVHLRVENKFGCRSEKIYPILVFPIPDAEFKVNSTLVDMLDPTVEFYDYSKNGYYYNWTFGDGKSSTERNPIHTYSEIGDYEVILKITTMYGCYDTANMKIQVAYSSIFYAPTAFTPNDDGNNDKFRVFLTNYETTSFEIKVFDRLGEIIYKSNDIEEGWNGMRKDGRMPVGVYTWIVKFKDLHGEEFTKTGSVTLLK